MNWIKICSSLFSVVACFTLLSGCGVTSKSVSADLSYTNSDISTISFSPDIKVVGLGEASHGVSEYQKMKADIFKVLVQSNGCQTFIALVIALTRNAPLPQQGSRTREFLFTPTALLIKSQIWSGVNA